MNQIVYWDFFPTNNLSKEGIFPTNNLDGGEKALESSSWTVLTYHTKNHFDKITT